MQVAGIITEYNPLHSGHVHLMREARRLLGPDTAVLCVMSGNFVQRGDFALAGKYARAEAAVRSGADLVLELGLPWAVSSAERFADGGVRTLLATGVVTHLLFGSECGEAAPLFRLAAALTGESFPERLRAELSKGVSFAAARERAAASLVSREDAALLRSPNNILGVEYCKSLLRRGGALRVVTVPRRGTPHDGTALEGEHPSASAVRMLLRTGQRDRALALMAPAMARTYLKEEAAGRAPVLRETCERAVLARLRTMAEADFAARLAVYPNHFWLLEEDGRVVSFVNGMVSDEPELRDEMYADASLHREDGAWQMIFGVNTLPEYRRRGLAGRVLERVIADARAQGRRGCVLTCKEALVHYYARFGFRSEGVSASTHGGVVWYAMRLTF